MEPSISIAEAQLTIALPRWKWGMQQRIRIRRPPADVYAALKAVELGEMRMARLLSALRFKTRGEAESQGKFEDVMGEGGWVTLVDNPGREVIRGLIGRFWQRDGGIVHVRDANEYYLFSQPGYTKLAFAYFLEESPSGTELTVATHVQSTDAGAAKRFLPYWALIRIGAALTMHSGLRAIRRRAERFV
jgi:hypothetical protein